MMIMCKMFCLLGICIAMTTGVPNHSESSKDISMKSSGNLPGCTNGRITYIIDTNINPAIKVSVFRITEAISCDECAHLCHTHYFCRSAGFEPNNRVESGGLCYLSYKGSRSCLNSEISSQRVTDFQTTEAVWIDCDVCTDPPQSIEDVPKIVTSVPVLDEDFKNEVDINNSDKKEHFTPIPEPEHTPIPESELTPIPEPEFTPFHNKTDLTRDYNETEFTRDHNKTEYTHDLYNKTADDLQRFAIILPIPEFTSRTEEGSGDE